MNGPLGHSLSVTDEGQSSRSTLIETGKGFLDEGSHQTADRLPDVVEDFTQLNARSRVLASLAHGIHEILSNRPHCRSILFASLSHKNVMEGIAVEQ